jgi:hypothetical protein
MFAIARCAASDEPLSETVAFPPRSFIFGFHSRSLRRSFEDPLDELICNASCGRVWANGRYEIRWKRTPQNPRKGVSF